MLLFTHRFKLLLDKTWLHPHPLSFSDIIYLVELTQPPQGPQFTLPTLITFILKTKQSRNRNISTKNNNPTTNHLESLYYDPLYYGHPQFKATQKIPDFPFSFLNSVISTPSITAICQLRQMFCVPRVALIEGFYYMSQLGLTLDDGYKKKTTENANDHSSHIYMLSGSIGWPSGIRQNDVQGPPFLQEHFGGHIVLMVH